MTDKSIVPELMAVIADRKLYPPSRSYVAKLLHGGIAAIGPKILEEAQEVVSAADESGDEGRAHLIHEVADLLFHSLVLLGERDIAWSEIEGELARRFGVSGLDEKASRTTS